MVLDQESSPDAFLRRLVPPTRSQSLMTSSLPYESLLSSTGHIHDLQRSYHSHTNNENNSISVSANLGTGFPDNRDSSHPSLGKWVPSVPPYSYGNSISTTASSEFSQGFSKGSSDFNNILQRSSPLFPSHDNSSSCPTDASINPELPPLDFLDLYFKSRSLPWTCPQQP